MEKLFLPPQNDRNFDEIAFFSDGKKDIKN